MGNYMSEFKALLVNQSTKEPCLPVTPYVKFPKDQVPAGENGLVTDIHILPEKMHRSVDDGSWYWWSDAQFVPFNDRSFFATTSAFQPRVAIRWTSVQSMPNGKVLLYNIVSENRYQCQAYGRTNTTVFPKVQPHPIGQLVSYCGTGEVAIMAMDGDPVFQKSRDLTNAVHVFCATARNGISFACLKRAPYAFFLETYMLDTVMLGNDSMRCHTICAGFLPSRSFMDSVQCKFSPDSNYITVSSSMGYLFTVKKVKLVKQCIICPDMLNQSLSSSAAFDYSPRFPFQMISVATIQNIVYTLNLETEEILISYETEQLVDCLQYSPDGLMLAMAFNNFDISIHDSQDLSCLHTIPMSSLCQAQIQRVPTDHLSIINLSFSQNGEHLASSTCDGHIRLWRIPRLFTLKELCRDVILTCLPVRRTKHLELPTRVKDFLMYKYF